MKLAAHPAGERVVNHLVLLNPRLSLECLGHDHGGVVVAVTRQVGDGHIRIGKRRADGFFDFELPTSPCSECRRATLRNQTGSPPM